MKRNPTTSTQRAARARRHHKLLVELIENARADSFNRWFTVLAKENPHGNSIVAARQFYRAWLAAGPKASKKKA